MTAAAIASRSAQIERHLGDPWDAGNVVRFTEILAADEREEMFAAGEEALDAYGLNAEFVPVAEGGRLSSMDDLVDIMRAVYRRDPCLGLGYGASSFIAAVNVWSAGDPAQRRTVARMLLANRKVACAYHELAHGNDMAGTELAARPVGGTLLIDGRKEVVTNIQRSDALVLFARTDPRLGSRSHSQILLDKATLPTKTYRYLPRFRSTGMRGVQLGGMEFNGCPVGEVDILGVPGHGLETAMRSFQLTRIALPAMMTGALETGLRVTLRHVLRRRLYGRAVLDIPYIRNTLAGVFADLLMCEAFAAAGLRALHLLPEEASVYAPAIKYGLARPMLDAMQRLAGVLGAQFYLRDGSQAIFQKLMRDLKPVAFGHVARATCQMTILPQLPLLARRSWPHGEPAPAALFAPDLPLPPLAFQRLTISSGGRDHLAPSLVECLDELAGATDPRLRDLRALVAGLVQELQNLTAECIALGPRGAAFPASVAAYELVDRYVAVLCAAACVGRWRAHHRAGDGFLADPAWVLAALTRLSAGGRPTVLPRDVEHSLVTELLHRHGTNRRYGLIDQTLP